MGEDEQVKIGMVMHYVAYGTPGGEHPSVCRAAMVTETGDGVSIGLAVMNPTGLFFNSLVFHDEDNRKGGTWHWPMDCEA